jgi:hypothetical protein
VQHLKCFEKVNKALQGQGKTKETPLLTIAQCRKVLDCLVERFPDHPFTKITSNSTLVTHPVWESAIIKLQNNQEDRLTTAEKLQVKRYLHVHPTAVAVDTDEDDDSGDGDGAFDILEKLEAQEKEVVSSRLNKTKYRSTKHALSTSVCVECLFSRAKLVMNDKRRGMSPYHLELLLFLHSNKDLWGDTDVHQCMKESEADEEKEEEKEEA